ncbi:MAG: SpoIID/LytB domain-containing protein [Pseudomonadota bacterium]
MLSVKFHKFSFILLFLLFSFNSLATLPEPLIRVAIQKNIPNLTIVSMADHSLTISDKNTNQEIWNGNSANIASHKTGLQINNNNIHTSNIIIEASNNLFQVGSNIYRGKLRVIKQNNSLLVINDLPLETYIAGLINSEISSSWPEETIKAQAIAARTYALNQIEQRKRANPSNLYDIGATTLDQVYFGAHREDLKSIRLVKATQGEVLKCEGKIFPAYYHSCCGGQTQKASNVWEHAKGPAPILDRFCERSPKHDWEFKISLKDFLHKISANKQQLNKIVSITTIPFFDSPRVNTLLIETTDDVLEIKATELRSLFGYSIFKSTWFEVKLEGNQLTFQGRGYGHGVGMCQWGAKGMAEQGYNYQDILKFYYPNAEIAKIY